MLGDSNTANLAALEALVHPLVEQAREAFIAEVRSSHKLLICTCSESISP